MEEMTSLRALVNISPGQGVCILNSGTPTGALARVSVIGQGALIHYAYKGSHLTTDF